MTRTTHMLRTSIFSLLYTGKKRKRFVPMVMLLPLLVLFIGCQLEKVDPFKQEVTQALDHFYQGEAYYEQRDLVAAEAEYRKSLAISPRPLTYFRLSQIAAIQNNLDQAIAYLDESLLLSPGFRSASLARQQMEGRRLSQMNNPILDRGIPETTDSLAETPVVTAPAEVEIEAQSLEPRLETDPAYLEMQTAQNEQNWSEAAVLGLKLLEQYPEDARLHYQVGYASVQLGVLEEAQTYLEKSVELDPGQGPVWNDLGVVLENRGQAAEAQRAYEQAVELGSSPDAFFNLAKLYEKQAKYREAIQLYERYLTFDATSEFGVNAQDRIRALRRLVY